MTCGPNQRELIAKKRIVEAFDALVACMSDGANISGLRPLVNSCSSALEAQAVLSIAMERAICFLSGGGGSCVQPGACPEWLIDTGAGPMLVDIRIYDAWARGINFNELQTTHGSIYIGDPVNSYDTQGPYPMTWLTTVKMDVLRTVGDSIYIQFQFSLLSYSADVLTDVVGDFAVASNANLLTIHIPVLNTVGRNFDTYGNQITSIRIPASVGAKIRIGGAFLTDVDISELTNWGGNLFEAANSALTESSVNAILVKLDELGTSNAGINLVNGTSHAPTGVGITAKNNLIGRGCTVQTN